MEIKPLFLCSCHAFSFHDRGIQEKRGKNRGYILFIGGVSVSIGIPPWRFAFWWEVGWFLVFSLSLFTVERLCLFLIFFASEFCPCFQVELPLQLVLKEGSFDGDGCVAWRQCVNQPVCQSVNKSLFISVGTTVRWLGHMVSLPASSPLTPSYTQLSH